MVINALPTRRIVIIPLFQFASIPADKMYYVTSRQSTCREYLHSYSYNQNHRAVVTGRANLLKPYTFLLL